MDVNWGRMCLLLNYHALPTNFFPSPDAHFPYSLKNTYTHSVFVGSLLRSLEIKEGALGMKCLIGKPPSKRKIFLILVLTSFN